MTYFDRLKESVSQWFSKDWTEKERAVKKSEHLIEDEEKEVKELQADLKNEVAEEQADINLFQDIELITQAIHAILQEMEMLAAKNKIFSEEEAILQYRTQLDHDQEMLVDKLAALIQQVKSEEELEEHQKEHLQQIQSLDRKIQETTDIEDNNFDSTAEAVQSEEQELTREERENQEIGAIEQDKVVIQHHLEQTSRQLLARLNASLRSLNHELNERDIPAIKQAKGEALQLYSFLKEEELLLKNVIHWTESEIATVEDEKEKAKEMVAVQEEIEAAIREEEERRRDEAQAEL